LGPEVGRKTREYYGERLSLTLSKRLGKTSERDHDYAMSYQRDRYR